MLKQFSAACYMLEVYQRVISLKLPEEVLEASRRCADALHLSSPAYIRRAIECMNRQIEAGLREKRLAEASKKVRKGSLRVNL